MDLKQLKQDFLFASKDKSPEIIIPAKLGLALIAKIEDQAERIEALSEALITSERMRRSLTYEVYAYNALSNVPNIAEAVAYGHSVLCDVRDTVAMENGATELSVDSAIHGLEKILPECKVWKGSKS